MTKESETLILDGIQKIKDTVIRSNPPRWLSAREAANYIGISEHYFRFKVKNNFTPAILGKRQMFDRVELDSFMENQKAKC